MTQLTRAATTAIVVATATIGLTATAPAATAAGAVKYTLRVCASNQTPTNATISYAVGVGESIAESGRTTRWLGSGCWQRSIAAYSYDTANIRATAQNSRAYIGCAVWANGRRVAKHYAYRSCALSGIRA
ncbi:hypothetical protein [Gordonia sp. CPCC 205333]|uniref:hypothetical protein n=1 Tax=Gordonia sp. CPCC 205333 TaxID=3140790 RepID=UPI003AF39DA2